MTVPLLRSLVVLLLAYLLSLEMTGSFPFSLASAAMAPPPPLQWAELVRQVSAAGCATTNCDALRELYDPQHGLCFHPHRHRRRADSVVGVCCRPIVLIATRAWDCPSCEEGWGALVTRYAPEMAVLAEAVTLVDGGDPMVDQLQRHPYPLPLPFTQSQLLSLEKRPHNASVGKDGDGGEGRPLLRLRVSGDEAADGAAEDRARAALSPDDREDLRSRELALRRWASDLAAHPPALRTRQWERLIRRAFAGQGDYVFRAVFVFPHNGSVMRDVINEDLVQGVDTHLHFFPSPLPFFAAAKKSIRVLDDALAHEALSHCT